MSNTFNINRFGLLLKRQWLEFGKIFLVSLLVIAGVVITFYGFNIPTPKHVISITSLSNINQLNMSFREPVFIITGFLFITIISSNYFAPMGQKPKAMIELMIPGSVLEKFLSAIFYTAIVTTASYFLIFFLIDISFVTYIKGTFEGISSVDEHGQRVTYTVQTMLESYTGPLTYPFYVLPLGISSLFLLGSIYFNRFHYIKTAVSVMIFSGVLSYVLYKTGRWMFEGKVRAMRSDNFKNINEHQAMYIVVAVLAALTLVLWIIGYVRLKEKEV